VTRDYTCLAVEQKNDALLYCLAVGQIKRNP